MDAARALEAERRVGELMQAQRETVGLANGDAMHDHGGRTRRHAPIREAHWPIDTD
jgi:hypothetical protein